MILRRAEKIEQVKNALSKTPLAKSDLEEFYKETDKARGKKTRSRLARTLTSNIGTNQHLLFVANRGCGKSTELVKLESGIEKDFLILKYSVFEDLDPRNINYIELIIITMEKLFAYVNNNNINIGSNYIQNVVDFTKSKEIKEINEKYMQVDTSMGSDVNFLATFFASFRISAKSSRSMKETLITNVEPQFSKLLGHCNDLIREIKLNLKTINKKDILIIIEDLDKIDLALAQSLFLDYANQITAIKTNVIYTFPINLSYNIHANQVSAIFTDTIELPMIKVTNKEGQKEKDGYEVMTEIIKARINLELFEDKSILDRFIELSGGVIRDLFNLIAEASEWTQDEEREQISKNDMLNAINKIKKDYSNTIADNEEDEITAEQYYQTLKEVMDNPTKKPKHSLKLMHLRHNLTVLSYNGEGWCDVHPIVKLNIQDMAVN